jgi:NADPH:quinone reductase-like Zn-dependent oxidoreductase
MAAAMLPLAGLTAWHAVTREVARHGRVLVIDRVFGFDEVPAALRHLEAGSHFGKVCVQL